MKNIAATIVVFVLAALCACTTPPEPPPPPPPPPASFSLTLEPSSFKVGPATKFEGVVRVARDAGFTGDVQLSFENLPADITASFDPNPATGDTSTLILATSKTSSARTVELNLKGVAGAAQASAKGSLEVTNALPPPTVTLEPSLKPRRAALLGFGGGAPRALVSVADAKGRQVDFTEDELIVVTDDGAALNAFLARYNGTVLRSKIPPASIKGLKPVYHVKVNLETVDASLTASRLGQLEPGKTGQLKISSLGAQRLVGVFAQERLNGLNITLNFIAKADTFNDNFSSEENSSNAMEWSYFRRGGNLDIDVASAWKALERAGKLDNKVRIGIVDEGFKNSSFSWTDNRDMPLVKDTRGIMGCDGDCKNYHGHKVALAAAGLADNSFGAAGPAGPVAELVFSGSNFNDVDVWEAYDILSDVPDAADMGAKIINMSFGSAIPATVSAVAIPIEDMTQTLRANGILLFASAGNDGEDVDAEDCFVGCWEEAWHTPCENDGVICVGGMSPDERSRDPDSNYGFEDVNIWAPFKVAIGPTPDQPNEERRNVAGTSYSSPFVAGVAALVWAANPNQSATQVWNRIRDNGVFFGNAPYLRRQVRAFKAVSAVLGNTSPGISISSITPPIGQDANTTNSTTFTAVTDDLEDANCCTVTWTSSLDGNMGTGNPRTFNFEGKQGTRTITATVKDSAGRTATDSRPYTIRNVPPTVSIEQPTAGKTFYRNQNFLLRGKGTDYTPFPSAVPCSSLTWRIRKSNGVLLDEYTGCERSVKFDRVEPLTIKLTVTDVDGSTATDETTVNLIERPASEPLEITSPVTESMYDQNETVILRSEHYGNKSAIVRTDWSITPLTGDKPPRTWTTQGYPTPNIIIWKPKDDFPIGRCEPAIPLRVRVTTYTDSGVSTDMAFIRITSECYPL